MRNTENDINQPDDELTLATFQTYFYGTWKYVDPVYPLDWCQTVITATTIHCTDSYANNSSFTITSWTPHSNAFSDTNYPNGYYIRTDDPGWNPVIYLHKDKQSLVFQNGEEVYIKQP